MNIQISVIVPIYNMQNFIVRTVDCLISQDANDIEFILIDDGSQDNTLALIHQKITGDSRFRVISISNHGYGYACNLGIREARGRYVGIYEPDDMITPDFYSELQSIANKYPHADVIRYNGIIKNYGDHTEQMYHWKDKYTGRMIDKYEMPRFWRSHPSIYNGLYKKNFIKKNDICFCETPSASFQDAMFLISLYYSDPNIFIINKAKYYYTIHANQSMQNIGSKIEQIVQNWKIEYDWLKKMGIEDKSFFQYRITMQTYIIDKKLHDRDIYKRLCKSLSSYYKLKFVFCQIATWKEKIGCFLMYLKIKAIMD